MGAVKPSVVDIRVAFLTVTVHHQSFLGNKIPARRARQRWFEVLLTFLGSGHVPPPGVLGMQPHHNQHDNSAGGRPIQTDTPTDLGTGQPVQHIQPNRSRHRQYVQPVNGAPYV